MKTLATILAMLLISSHVYASDIIENTSISASGPKAFILTYGTFTQVQMENPEQPGVRLLNYGVLSQKLLEQTDTISARPETVIGMEFGLICDATDSQETLIFTITPPKAIHNPDTNEPLPYTTFSRTIEQTKLNPFIGFRFDNAWECISGTWLFQVHYKNNVIVEKRLMVNFE